MPIKDIKSLLATRSGDKWKKIGAQKRAGALVPLFSVYSRTSIGIGDFDDLGLLIDWCSKTGLSILQLLPMNEVGATFCPYDAVSSFALEPSYISLESLSIKDGPLKKSIRGLKAAFPAGRPHVDYGIKQAKVKLLRSLYRTIRASNPDKTEGSKEFKEFIEDNAYWIDDFALFKVLKEYHKGKPWYQWEERYRERDQARLDEFREEHRDEIAFQKWLQWVAFSQFKSSRRYAESKKVRLFGDLPILISKDSADVWMHREFFKLDSAAGAPPDVYCAKGQRWGQPTYDWGAISSDGYRYLKEKLKAAGEFYDILRVDHIVGLFRIWSIPYNETLGNEGMNGSFDPPDESQWYQHGRQILSVMCDSTAMLLCGEDLGMIPKVCPDTMAEFGIPGNDVQRWTKDWQEKHDFLDPEDYRMLAVSMLSTHDTTNWPSWWENEAGTVDEALFKRKCLERGIDYDNVKSSLFDSARSGHGRLRWLDGVVSADALTRILGKRKEELADFIEIYENTYREKERLWKCLNLKGRMREKCDQSILRAVLGMTFVSRSIFCIQLLTDYLYLAGVLKGDPYRYRINYPGTISKENWSMTMPIPLEELIGHKICADIKDMVLSSGRAEPHKSIARGRQKAGEDE